MPLRPRTRTATTSRNVSALIVRGRGRRLELRQIVENFRAVLPGVDVEIVLADDALGIDEKRVAGGKFGEAEIHERIVSGRDLIVRVRQEFEMQSLFRAELLV